MKVSVTRSGGIAGLSRTWAVATDEQPDREAWEALLASLPWDERASSAPQPDRYVYVIQYSRRRVTLPEQSLTGPWRELVDRVKSTQ
jgi:hypothetical protein